MEVLIEFFMMLFVFLIVVLLFSLAFIFTWLLLGGCVATFRSYWKRGKKYQFRLRTLFTGVTTFSVTMALLKSFHLLDSSEEAIAFGCIAILPSLTVVLIVEFVYEDLSDLYLFHRKPSSDPIPTELEATENGSDELKMPGIQTINESDQRTDQERLDMQTICESALRPPTTVLDLSGLVAERSGLAQVGGRSQLMHELGQLVILETVATKIEIDTTARHAQSEQEERADEPPHGSTPDTQNEGSPKHD